MAKVNSTALFSFAVAIATVFSVAIAAHAEPAGRDGKNRLFGSSAPAPGPARTWNIYDGMAGDRAAAGGPVTNTVVAAGHGPKKNILLRGELRQLLETHPRLRAGLKSINAAKFRTRAAFSEFLPLAELTGDSGREVIDSPARRNTQGEASGFLRKKITLSVTQNLFNGFGSMANHDVANTRRQITELNYDSARQDVLLEGATAYISVLRQDRLVKLARQNEIIIKRQLQLEDERVQRGSGIAVDVLLAKTRLQLAIERRVQLEGATREAIARYRQVFNTVPEISSMAEPEVSLDMIPRSIDDAINTAIDKNPSLGVSDLQIVAARRTKDAEFSGFYPLIDIVGQGNWEDDVDAVEGIRRDWSVLLRFSWQLFSGLATRSRVASAALDHAAAQDSHKFNRRKVVEGLRLAWEQLETARKRIELLQNARVIAGEVFRARQRLRDAGRETAINVLDAQSEVFAAQINFVAASFDAKIAVFRVMFSMGVLTPEFLKI